MPRFVILTHDFPEVHLDFMVEFWPILRTWRLPEQFAANTAIQVEELPDHRLLYLDYEGSISGHRGTVRRWDKGIFIPILSNDDHLQLELHGSRIRGIIDLMRGNSTNWTMVYRPTVAQGLREPPEASIK